MEKPICKSVDDKVESESQREEEKRCRLPEIRSDEIETRTDDLTSFPLRRSQNTILPTLFPFTPYYCPCYFTLLI